MRHKSRKLLAALVAVFAVTAFAASTALASGKPFVETKPATSIGETTATLNGIVNPNGATTKYHFEYGTTASYGKSTVEVSVGFGTTNLEEAKAITALTASTTYHFRIAATNINGTSDGADQVFSTTGKPAPPEFVLAKGETFPLAVEGKIEARETGDIAVETGSNKPFVCEQDKAKGSITGAKAVSLTHTLEGCYDGQPARKCNSEGAAAGVVVLSGAGSLAYLNKSTKQVGVVLPVGTVKLFCGAVEEKLVGSIISPIAPVNIETTKPELTYHQKKAGEEEFTSYENEKGEKVLTKFLWSSNGGAELAASLQEHETIKLTAPKALTIKA